MTKNHNFRELKIWQESLDLAVRTYKYTSDFPNEEKFGLVSQMRRCSVSIPSNIAEGSGRTSDKEFLHFLKISLSSSYELETRIILSGRLYEIKVDEQLKLITDLQKKIGAFIRKLKTDNGSES